MSLSGIGIVRMQIFVSQKHVFFEKQYDFVIHVNKLKNLHKFVQAFFFRRR